MRIDKPGCLVDDHDMADLSTSSRRRVLLADHGDADRHLRVTWHQDEHVVVFSQWTGSVCTAATPVSVTETASLATLLVEALGQEVHSVSAASAPSAIQPRRAWHRKLIDRLRRPGSSPVPDAIPFPRRRAS